MDNQTNQFGIEETLEVRDFLEAISSDIAMAVKAGASRGKSPKLGKLLAVLMSRSEEFSAALEGSEKLRQELGELSLEEFTEIVGDRLNQVAFLLYKTAVLKS